MGIEENYRTVVIVARMFIINIKGEGRIMEHEELNGVDDEREG